MNYVAVATALGMSREEFVAGVAADNVFALAYFPLVSFLARRCDARESAVGDDTVSGDRGDVVAIEATGTSFSDEATGTSSSRADALTAAFVAVVLLAAGQALARVLERPPPNDEKIDNTLINSDAEKW